ncbi:MAG: hypothetical protein LBF19_06895 [Prevotellaceae bacterium]|jgi:hypothetical protein|nr:hypothetical protein [Prevotellaceae bacterium]
MGKPKKNRTGNRAGNAISRLFSGRSVNTLWRKHGGYLFYVFVLALLYIGFHYNMAQTVRRVRQVEREVKNLRAEYKMLDSKLMQMNKQSTITRLLKERNITTIAAPQTPPKRIGSKQ